MSGVSVEFDREWLWAWRLFEQNPRALESYMRWFAGSREYFSQMWRQLPQIHEVYATGRPLDVNWRPPYWDAYLEFHAKSADPFGVVVVLEPGTQKAEAPWWLLEQWRFNVRTETRPAARLLGSEERFVRGGISVNRPRENGGTLGGVVRDESGAIYGITCAHVISKGDIAESSHVARRFLSRLRRVKPHSIGRCVESSTLQPGGDCNPYREVADNVIDAAIVRLSDPSMGRLVVTEVGGLSGIAAMSSLEEGVVVRAVGSRSGMQRLRIGGLALTRTINEGGERYCFKDLIELRHPGYFWGLLGSFPRVVPGDSGAWVVTEARNGPEWAGMVVAGDGPVAYASPSQLIVEWAREAGYDLSVH